MASSQDRTNGPFHCPACKNEAVLRKGKLRIPHFSHKPPVTCSYGLGETEVHRRCKTEIYDTFLHAPHVEKVKLERYLKEVRPDISAYINGVPVAIEVQISNLSLDDVIRRTREYTRRGIHLLWLAEWTSALDDERYSPRPWERWIHAAYFGRVYYWVGGTLVVPYHFEPFHLRVKESEWNGRGGKKLSAGGYSRRSMRYKTPVRGSTLDILRDFGPKEREYWQGRNIEIPRAKLFCDFGVPFWKLPNSGSQNPA